MFTISTPAECRSLAANAPQRISLYDNIWHEREFACVLADNSVAAASEALRIAAEVANSRKVLFFALQCSLSEFVERCNASNSDKLIRAGIDLADMDPKDIGQFLDDIEQTIVHSGVRVCVLDSLFYLSEWYGKAGATRFFIMKFREMTRRLGIAFLVGAIARKRIGKTGIPSAEHLPKGTAPYVDAIIGAQAKNPDAGEEASQSEVSESCGRPCGTEKQLSRPSKGHRKNKVNHNLFRKRNSRKSLS